MSSRTLTIWNKTLEIETDFKKADIDAIDAYKFSQSGRNRRLIYFEKKGDNFWLHLNGRTVYGTFKNSSFQTDDGIGTDGDLVAQFPGKVKKIFVREGQNISEGDSLILLEAMKMEFTVKAPYSGVVKQIIVNSDEQIMPGQKLIDLERDK